MAIKASATVTLSCYRDTASITRYYKLQSSTASAPSKPTTKPPSGWTDAEPSYTSGSTNTLYFCDLTVFSDGTWAYSTVSKSSSYEAAKEAYNKAVAAKDAADNAQEDIDNLEIGGRNLLLKSNVEKATSEYCIGFWTPSDFLVAGETYTVSICVIPAPNVANFSIYVSSGNADLAVLNTNGTSEQILSKTFTARYYSGKAPSDDAVYGNVQLFRFPNDGTVTSNSVLKWIKIEKGNKATDWTPAPEDIETEVSELTIRVANAELDIDSANAQIELRATKSEVTTLSNNLANNYYTKTQSDSNLTVKANEITSSVAETYTTKTEFNALEVGGRNLLLDSANPAGHFYWSKANGSATKTSETMLGVNGVVLDITTASTNWAYCAYPFGASRMAFIKPDTYYTFSFDIYPSIDAGPCFTIMEGNSSNKATTTSTEQRITANKWNHVALTVKSKSTIPVGNQLVYLHGLNSVGTYKICNFKLEEGNKATDWSPAPEDMATNIDLNAVNQSVTTLSSDIRQLNNSVTTSFSKTTEEITALQNSVNGLNNNISNVDKKVSEVTAWFNQSMDSGGNPVLELGTTANDLSMELSNSQLAFKDGGVFVAYINGQKLYISSAEITDQLKFGNYAWIPNGSHMTLRYLG